MQGVHRVIQSLSLFDVVSGYVKQLPCPSASAVSACSMRPGSLVLSTSKSAALYNSLHALLSKDLELPVFIIPLRFASMVYHWIEPATAESVVPFTPFGTGLSLCVLAIVQWLQTLDPGCAFAGRERATSSRQSIRYDGAGDLYW